MALPMVAMLMDNCLSRRQLEYMSCMLFLQGNKADTINRTTDNNFVFYSISLSFTEYICIDIKLEGGGVVYYDLYFYLL